MREGRAEILEVCNECGFCVNYCPENAIVPPLDVEAAEAPLGPREEYRNVWVFAEQRGGIIRDASLEALGKARGVADMLGARVEAVLMGQAVGGLAPTLIQHGADAVYLLDAPFLGVYRIDLYKRILAKLIGDYKPEILLLGATGVGNGLASALAARLKTGAVTNCTQLDIDPSERLLLATKPVYEGRLLATMTIPKLRPQIATVQPGVFHKPFPDPSRRGHLIEVEVAKDDSKIEIVSVTREEGEERGLEGATVVVAGGRGMVSQEGFKLVGELAKALGGRVGASKAAVDLGWASEDLHIGLTGVSIRPKLYAACGVSGTLEHLGAVGGSPTIVAIHGDPEDPIFDVAHIGVVGDPREVIPHLIEELRGRS